MAITLYYIAHEAEEGNRDLFVSARDEAEAVALWRDYYSNPELPEPDDIFVVPVISETPMAHQWADVLEAGEK